VGALAGATPAPARSTAFDVLETAHVSPSCRPPGPKLPAAVRARELAGEEGAFDFHRVGSYDLHQCLRASGRTLPSLAKRSAGRVLARQVVCTLSPDAKKGNPKAALTVSILNVATPYARAQSARR